MTWWIWVNIKEKTLGNFNWFLHFILFYHTRYVSEKKKQEVNEEKDDDDKNTKHWMQGTILPEKYCENIPNIVNILHQRYFDNIVIVLKVLK